MTTSTHVARVIPASPHGDSRRWRLLGCLGLALLALLAAADLAVGAPGELDSSFGSGGKALVDFGGVDRGRALALAPDGRIVVAGASQSGTNSDFALARLQPNGSLDGSFGGGGKSRTDLRGDAASGVVVQPDARIVVAGTSDAAAAAPGAMDFAVARLQPDGGLDGAFGSAGTSFVNFGGTNDNGHAVALQADGKIVVAGLGNAGSTFDFGVTRLQASGQLDAAFGTQGSGGRTLTDFGGVDSAHAVVLQPDGKIVVAGYGNDGRDFAVARLQPDGSLDVSFGPNAGKSPIDFGGPNEVGNAVALQPDGKIVVAGYGNEANDFAVARLQANGLLDPSFGSGGRSLIDFGGPSDVGHAVALQADGKIVVAGYGNDGKDFAVARLQPNGSLDSTFASGGKSLTDFGGIDAGQAMVLQPDGKIVVAGLSIVGPNNNDFAIARLQGDPGRGGADDPGGGRGGRAGAGRPPTCAGRRATIVGTRAADRLRGTRRRDVIAGLGGRDRIPALGGADIVCAGAGNDTVAGGGGNDRLYGERGRDQLRGERGRDQLFGGPGRDRLSGGPGRDDERQ